ncbi:sigma-70 family RNA polymerase sigma factor [bacterium]|nr:sigma-70 family RNA polymerase sigma factor [bacterium]
MSEKADRPNPASDQRESEQERAEERALFARYQADPCPANEELLLKKYQSLVYKIVHKFTHGSDQFDDLVQEGTKGLLLAIRRFDLSLNYRFSTYAWQTIQGEIQRYFRDRTWAVNVPRDLKEKSLKVFKAREELAAAQTNEPTVTDVAKFTSLSEEDVLEAMELGSAYHPQSFMDNARDGDAGIMLSEESPGAEHLDMRTTKRGVFWENLLIHLTDVEQRIIRMYFFEQRTQKEIATILNTSQMNVSRIMRNAIGKIRRLVEPADFENLGML